MSFILRGGVNRVVFKKLIRPHAPLEYMTKPSQQDIRKFVAKGRKDRELIKELLKDKKPKSNK